jgi:uncharacterized membrane protein
MRYPSQTQKRIIVKSISYRFIGLLINFCITYLLTKNTNTAVKASLFIEILQTFAYYGWENLWNQIEWGMVTKHD